MNDFALFVAECGLTPELLEKAKGQVGPLADCPAWAERNVVIGASPIEGLGVFSAKAFSVGEKVAPARVERRWTAPGRYANHSSSPNCAFTANGDFEASRAINPGEEVTVNYRQVKTIYQPNL